MVDIILFVYRDFGSIDCLSHLHFDLALSNLAVVQLILNLKLANGSLDLYTFLYVFDELLLDQ
jgi:hypothetical protein